MSAHPPPTIEAPSVPQVQAPEPTTKLPDPTAAPTTTSAIPIQSAVHNTEETSALPTSAITAPRRVSVTAAGAAIEATAGKTTKSKKKKQPVVTMATAVSAQSGSQGTNGENTGRWTAEEHRLFLQGLEQHGKGWKKIASLIKSRTVVQIRTHAQKYFQKLAKARQNGEEGDVTMEGRGGNAAAPSVASTAAQTNKRRRQTSGTKRKAIQSVVASAQRQGKKLAAAQAAAGNPLPTPPLPAVAPALAHFVLPGAPVTSTDTSKANNSCVPSITTAHGTISGPALEDSLFRFLTPTPVEPLVNDVARQAGANPITLPSDNPGGAPAALDEGEVSPTGVNELAIYPSWTDAKDTPSWYAKGADVDALLDVADTLDWLTDSGDLHESYQPPPVPSLEPAAHAKGDKLNHAGSTNSMNTDALPRADASVEDVVPPLPSLFGGAEGEAPISDRLKHSGDGLQPSAASTATIEDHLNVFDTPMEEQDFVSTLLENNGESTGSLAVLS